jgi:hypothetical protein
LIELGSVKRAILLLALTLSFVTLPSPAQEARKYVCLIDPQVSSEEPGTCAVCGYDLIAADLAASGYIAFTCSEHREIQQSIPGKCPKCERKLVMEDLRAKPKLTYVCPMHPAVTSFFAGKCPRCAMELVREDLLQKKSAAYRCPMDPTEVSGKPAKCSKCGMNLVAVDDSELLRFPMEITTQPNSFRSGDKVRMHFKITNPITKEPVKEFDVVHEKLFHLFVISQDLEFFDHIHPERLEDGSFVIETSFPRPAHYRLYADFLPTGGTPQVVQKSLITSDCESDLFSSQARLTPDMNPKTVTATTVTLKTDPSTFIAGREATLLYRLTDEKTGDGVTDLRPYLGAWGHTFIINDDGSESIHSHPVDELPAAADLEKARNQPEISFQAFFPKPGFYRVWSQFLRRDQVSTYVFTIEVRRLR